MTQQQRNSSLLFKKEKDRIKGAWGQKTMTKWVFTVSDKVNLQIMIVKMKQGGGDIWVL